MTQVAPSTLFYDQALVKVEKLIEDYKSGAIQDVDAISEGLRAALTQFGLVAGTPIAQFDPVAAGEPPLSAKTNQFFGDTQHDVNIMQKQVDFLRASINLVYNSVTTEIEKARLSHARLRTKVDVLQMYGESPSVGVFTFVERFNSDDFFDPDAATGTEQAYVVDGSFLSLARAPEQINLTRDAEVKILPSSNGILGNNQEILDPSAAPNDSSGKPFYGFVGEQTPGALLPALTDADPLTWIEYESYVVTPADRLRARNLGFHYSDTSTEGNKYDWAKGPSDKVLKLDLEFDLKVVYRANNLVYSPFGLAGNANLPVHVEKISTSTDGTNWEPVNPQSKWVATNQNIHSARVAADLTVGDTVWSFGERDVRFVQVSVRQPNPINCNIGHLYYTDKAGSRVEGPIPSIDNPLSQFEVKSLSSGQITQGREYFRGLRYAVGIRDISIQQVSYAETSTIVSKPIHLPGIVDKVAIDADLYIPEDWSSDTSWVRFFISADDGASWNEISRITDDLLGAAEIIAYNDPNPLDYRDPNLGYVETDRAVTSLRVKIELSRPSNVSQSSPLVRSYTLKVKTR